MMGGHKFDDAKRLSTFDALDAISRERPLTESETRRLAWAIQHRARGDNSKGQKPWTRDELSRLRRYLKRGKKPAQIAPLLGRTERAIWRKIYKEQLQVGKLCPATIFTASRLRVQSHHDR
jgi:hypothetical protein